MTFGAGARPEAANDVAVGFGGVRAEVGETAFRACVVFEADDFAGDEVDLEITRCVYGYHVGLRLSAQGVCDGWSTLQGGLSSVLSRDGRDSLERFVTLINSRLVILCRAYRACRLIEPLGTKSLFETIINPVFLDAGETTSVACVSLSQ